MRSTWVKSRSAIINVSFVWDLFPPPILRSGGKYLLFSPGFLGRALGRFRRGQAVRQVPPGQLGGLLRGETAAPLVPRRPPPGRIRPWGVSSPYRAAASASVVRSTSWSLVNSGPGARGGPPARPADPAGWRPAYGAPRKTPGCGGPVSGCPDAPAAAVCLR